MKRRLGKIIKAMGYPTSFASILLTGDDEIRELNQRFRGIDKSTNVLSFPANNDTLCYPVMEFLGDVVVSTDTIVREAAELDIFQGELLYFYLIHGLLHLVGYDHEKGPEQERAQEMETERLMSLILHDL